MISVASIVSCSKDATHDLQPAPRRLSAIGARVRHFGTGYELEIVGEICKRAEVSAGVLLEGGADSLDVLLRHRPLSIAAAIGHL
jgi:hypothetical protein